MTDAIVLGARRDRPSTASAVRLLAWTLIALCLLLGWDASGLDRTLAHRFGGSSGFPLRDHWFFVHVMHEDARRLAWLFAVALVLSVWWPFGVLRSSSKAERLQLAVTTLLALALVSTLKYASTTSCPWDLAEFGGVARYASHWALGSVDGGSGKCFPAGHASAGFAFVGGYFALRRNRRRAARIWLIGSLAAGIALGFSQQMRGAHFQSHTLWTGWLCWVTALLIDFASRRFAPADDNTRRLMGATDPA
ncbi:MAG: phosphatase PAP2 family protein [Burkholderiaceae bacterium]|jgi:membrane-associated PAP2 superfamily phosphatase|nr:phosphatase PAP2 family protein [Burkholderiaceae bacterium]MCO5103755.1 phosphatase PAP2 family protein [Burkholderiaceae bacterium]